jgi:hypothetical protein
MERGIQTRIDDFYQTESKDQNESLRRIHETHVSKMEQIFNEIFSKLFDGEEYIRRV